MIRSLLTGIVGSVGFTTLKLAHTCLANQNEPTGALMELVEYVTVMQYLQTTVLSIRAH